MQTSARAPRIARGVRMLTPCRCLYSLGNKAGEAAAPKAVTKADLQLQNQRALVDELQSQFVAKLGDKDGGWKEYSTLVETYLDTVNLSIFDHRRLFGAVSSIREGSKVGILSKIMDKIAEKTDEGQYLNLATSLEHRNDIGRLKALIEKNPAPSTAVMNCLLRTYIRIDDIFAAAALFESLKSNRTKMVDAPSSTQLPIPNASTYSAVIHMYYNQGKLRDVETLFKEMVECGLAPSTRTYGVMMQTFIRFRRYREAIEVFEQLRKSATSNIPLPALQLYVKALVGSGPTGVVEAYRWIVDRMDEPREGPLPIPDVFVFNTVIYGAGAVWARANAEDRTAMANAAVDLFKMITKEGAQISANAGTYQAMIQFYCNIGNDAAVDMAKSLMTRLRDLHHVVSAVTLTKLLSALIARGKISEAYEVFVISVTDRIEMQSSTLERLIMALLDRKRVRDATFVAENESFAREGASLTPAVAVALLKASLESAESKPELTAIFDRAKEYTLAWEMDDFKSMMTALLSAVCAQWRSKAAITTREETWALIQEIWAEFRRRVESPEANTGGEAVSGFSDVLVECAGMLSNTPSEHILSFIRSGSFCPSIRSIIRCSTDLVDRNMEDVVVDLRAVFLEYNGPNSVQMLGVVDRIVASLKRDATFVELYSALVADLDAECVGFAEEFLLKLGLGGRPA